ncbi:hypothetical protein PH210_11385 [Paenibacillus sp. BSR1-1]|uniref:hypothetical protein n=1 Tax=Paenibacillus sp. BSR1-1 TaxID=3020845 RepID=UPI0025B1ECAE|nr:hypothetical protein [Paenibacillus sp. BSR1-1]MDN3016798.1 hypothetical protein [Paenibacillus sp. BSR1-1]
MIFASDLDRTLVYSKRALDELGIPEGMCLKPVEKKDGRWVAYMTESSFSTLKELIRHSVFIPVTTRTTEQFNRFTIFTEDFQLKYAITTNGATILHQGEQLEEWSKHIFQKLAMDSASLEELLAVVQREGYHFEGQLKQVENLFFYYILDSFPDSFAKSELNELAAKYGWRISLQGKKLYFMPMAIRKGAALEYICQREGMKAIAGAGDSLLDLDFLDICQYRFVPNHGEVACVSKKTGLTLTTNSGALAGEEILHQFLKRCFTLISE